MKQFMYTIHDSKAKTYSVPFVQINEQTALRMFDDMVNNKESQYGKHPSDYSLVFIAEYETDTGQVVPTEIPQFIANGADMIRPE